MKLRRKLLSAGLALGATALTLTTSTFAWYTANSEVSMTGAQGVSASNGSSLLLISKEATDGTFKNSVQLNLSTSTLQPVAYKAGDSTNNYKPKFYSFADGKVVTSSEANTAHILQFDLYFKSTAVSTVYIKNLVVSNTTTAANWSNAAKDVLSTAGLHSGWNVASNATYNVDLMRALKVAWYSENHAGDSEVGSNFNGQAYDLGNIAHKYGTADSIGSYTDFNAHTYYNAVTGNSIPTDGDDTIDATTNPNGSDTKIVDTAMALNSSYNVGSVAANTATNYDLHVHFYFFIDGWDLECFDAVQGQTFTVALTFDSRAGTTLANS